VGKDPDAAQKEAAYVDRLITEILGQGRELAGRYTVDTVFIGGGTPSILPAEYISRLISSVQEVFCLEKGAEITMESNPGTLSEEKLKCLREAGVNRLSIGLQSFDNRILKAMGRIHTAEEFLKSYDMARKAGFRNVNIDLMFDFPGQTTAQWEDTMKKALALRPEHLSFYGLQIEEGTPLYEDYKMERIPELDEQKDAEMYFRALDLLGDAGYHHYEISNAALPGYECRHNMKYWRFQDYLGVGASASSFLDGVRITEYPGSERHVNTFLENCGEYVFTALRTDEGVSLEKFREQFGKPLWDVFSDRREEFEEYQSRGLVREEKGRILLTREGIPVSNEIMALFV
jgi:oxygen-independent coproporphyrinogen-3 oxidase